MPATINPIRKARVKKSLLEGKSIRQSLKDAGYSERVAHGNCDKDFPVVKSCMEEIKQELEDNQLIAKAFNALNKCLSAGKDSDKIAAAQALLRFKVGEKSNINNLNPEKIIVAYGSTNNEVNITTLDTDNSGWEEAKEKKNLDGKS